MRIGQVGTDAISRLCFKLMYSREFFVYSGEGIRCVLSQTLIGKTKFMTDDRGRGIRASRAPVVVSICGKTKFQKIRGSWWMQNGLHVSTSAKGLEIFVNGGDLIRIEEFDRSLNPKRCQKRTGWHDEQKPTPLSCPDVGGDHSFGRRQRFGRIQSW